MASSPPRTDGGIYRWYVLTLLISVYMMHHLDRVVFSLLQEPIKNEFHLNDSELALVSGTVFAISFGIFGLPLGWLADRMRRVSLLAVIIGIWSGLTALASQATLLSQLLLIRVGIGAAESGSTPTNLSLISDYFQTKRSTAIGFYMTGAQFGTLVGFALTGFVAAHYGWRAGLLAAGLPGFFLIVLVLLTVREPPRQNAAARPSLLAGLGQITANPALVHVIAATTLANVVAPGISLWLPSLLMRSGGADIGWTGMAIGLTTAPIGVIGAITAGLVTEKVATRRPAAMLWLMAGLALLYIPAILYAVSGGPQVMLIGFCIQLFCHMWVSTPGYALSMDMAAPHLRGTTGALLQVLSNFLGFGIGPMVGGVLSDLLKPHFGADSLRYALGIFVFLNLWTCFHLLRAASLVSKSTPDGTPVRAPA